MKNDITAFAKLVTLKKRFVSTQILPNFIAVPLSEFFNNLHNLIIQTKDLTMDTIIRTRDVARDHIIRTRDVTKDHVIRTRDTTIDRIIQAKDKTDDFVTRNDSALNTLKRYKKKGFTWKDIIAILKALSHLVVDQVINQKYRITIESDQRAVESVESIIANSEHIQKEIKRVYKRDAEIVYPPIHLPENISEAVGEFWLSVNRLVEHKRVEIQIEAFNQLPTKKLIIVGGFDDNSLEYSHRLQAMAKSNITFVGSVDEKRLAGLYRECRGFITTARNEDFGMTAVEAMSYGKPVIAPDEGGYKETILNKKTGILINEINSNKVVEAILEIEGWSKTYRDDCLEQAKKFSDEIFARKIENHVKNSVFFNNKNQLIFIVGVPRSGNTWLWGLLTSHPDIEPLTRSDFSGKKNITPEGKYESVETNMLFDYSLENIREVINKKTKRYIVEKTPDHLLKIEKIKKEFPQAKIIHIIRNPFSVYASYRYSNWENKISDPHEWLVEYQKRIEKYIENSNYKNLLTVRYESLMRNPIRQLKRINAFIHLYDNNPLKQMVLENHRKSKSIGNYSIRKAEISSWKYELNNWEIRNIAKGLWKYSFFKKYLLFSLPGIIYNYFNEPVTQPYIIDPNRQEYTIIVPEYKFIYYALAKTGSSSIKEHISNLTKKNPDQLLMKRRQDYLKFPNYFKFTFVRNPWDRILSCYLNKIMKDPNFEDKNYAHGIARFLQPYRVFHGGMSFKDFVKAISKIDDKISNPHFRSQYYMLIDDQDKIIVDYVGKFESLSEDFKKVAARCGLPSSELPHINKTENRKNYTEYYDEETIRLVAERYKKDIELFGYKFKSSDSIDRSE